MRTGRGSATAVVSLGCGIAALVCVMLAGYLGDSSARDAFRAGRDRLFTAVVGWICGLVGILTGLYLSYAVLLSVAWKSVRRP